MKHFYTKILAVMLALMPFLANAQGVTSASISGKVIGTDGKGAAGAFILAIHESSNTKYGGRTTSDGSFTINGLRVGGPYKIKASILGQGEDTKENIFLNLGSNRQNFNLSNKENKVKEVLVSAKSQAARSKTGSETNIGKEQIMSMPTISRSINDFTRLTPEANLNNASDGISINGANNRYNAIYIDGAVNNDVFGLTEAGTNGASSGVSPFSIDAIESFNVQTAPYDVRQGGFAGGAINAVTRSGTNEVEGSVYLLYRNQDMAGTTPNQPNADLRTKLENSYATTLGARVGLPLEKDKLFLFTNVEYTKEEYQLPFDFSTYRGSFNQNQIEQIANKARSYGYEPGSYMNSNTTVENWKIITKLDYNISQKSKLSLRYSYNGSNSINPERTRSNRTLVVFSNNLVSRPNQTHNLALEHNTQISDKISNNLILGYTKVNDDRGIIGEMFPSVELLDQNNSTVRFGSERSSSVNLLQQNIYTLTNNLTFQQGKHNIVFGTHNEFYNIYNSFINNANGRFSYRSTNPSSNLNAFLNNLSTNTRLEQDFSLVDRNGINDNTASAANFNAMQLGFYVQDEMQVSDKLRFTFGLRADVPFYLTQTKTNNWFNDTVSPLITAAGYDLAGARSGQMPSTSIHFSPRVGFNYDVNGDASLIIRGGTGVFTSRIPFVWIGGLYQSDGLTRGSSRLSNTSFNSDPEATIPSSNNRPLGFDVIEKDFKLPQVWKTSLAIDKKLPWNMNATLEATFSKILNNYMVDNYGLKLNGKQTNGSADVRDLHSDLLPNKISSIMVIKNTGVGYSWNTSATIGRNVSKGLSFNGGYTFGVSKVLNEATSSVNFSNWANMETQSNHNRLRESYSDFDMGHRFFGSVSYRKEWNNFLASSISLFFNGQSGRRFSWVYTGDPISGNFASNGTDLMYVPATQSDINLVDYRLSNGSTYTAAQQWADLDAYINANDYLNSKRGQYADRNGDRLPFQFTVDVRFAQEFFVRYNDQGKRKNSFEITFDIFNFTNLLNNDWGVRYQTNFDQVSVLSASNPNNGSGKTEYRFNKPTGSLFTVDDNGVQSSRWQGQLGLRYNF
jgi:hypothetical protein